MKNLQTKEMERLRDTFPKTTSIYQILDGEIKKINKEREKNNTGG